MLLENSTLKTVYLANGSVTKFDFRFPILDNSHVKIYKSEVDALGIETSVEVPTTEYSVTGAGNQQGGSVTFKTAPASGVKIAIMRNVPFTQVTQYTELDNFPAESHENALTKLTMICLQLLENISRCLYFPETSDEDPAEYLNKWQTMYAEVIQAYEKIMQVRGEWFNYTIEPFTTKEGVLVYDVKPDNIVLDPLYNNILLIVDDVVQEPDLDYSITGTHQITFKSNPGDGKRVWGTSCFSWSNPDIRAILEKALQAIQDEATAQIALVTQTGAAQVALVVQTGTEQTALVTAEGDKQVQRVIDEGGKQVQLATDQALLSQAWAESDTNPDPTDPDSHSAKWWAETAGQSVPYASKTLAGKVQIGDGLDVGNKGLLSLGADVASKIDTNTQNIETNKQAIASNAQAIAGNTTAIQQTNTKVGQVETEVDQNTARLAELTDSYISGLGMPKLGENRVTIPLNIGEFKVVKDWQAPMNGWIYFAFDLTDATLTEQVGFYVIITSQADTGKNTITWSSGYGKYKKYGFIPIPKDNYLTINTPDIFTTKIKSGVCFFYPCIGEM